jgi:acyl-CoA thioester hydrolase
VHQAAIFSGALGPPFGFAVRRMEIDFLKPARMDDLITIETAPEGVRGASIDIVQRILREDEVLVTAYVRVACVSDGRPARLPGWVREKLET